MKGRASRQNVEGWARRKTAPAPPVPKPARPPRRPGPPKPAPPKPRWGRLSDERSSWPSRYSAWRTGVPRARPMTSRIEPPGAHQLPSSTRLAMSIEATSSLPPRWAFRQWERGAFRVASRRARGTRPARVRLRRWPIL